MTNLNQFIKKKSKDVFEQTIDQFNRVKNDISEVDRLIKKIKDGISLNPIVLNKKYKIQDGNHRFIAYKTLRFKEIDVYLEI